MSHILCWLLPKHWWFYIRVTFEQDVYLSDLHLRVMKLGHGWKKLIFGCVSSIVFESAKFSSSESSNNDLGGSQPL